MSRLVAALIGVGLFAVGIAAGAFAFGNRSPGDPLAGDPYVMQPHTAAPDEFAVFPCNEQTRMDDPYAPCVLIMAGGKRLIFGAPMAQDWRGMGYLDALFLYNGHPISSNGLLGARYYTWRNGRAGPLLVVAGDLQLDAINALDEAQANADALTVFASGNTLSFNDAKLRPKPVPAAATGFKVFDTGDLQVLAYSQISEEGDQIISYDIIYQGHTARFQPCGAETVSRPADSLIIPVAEKSSIVMRQRELLENQMAEFMDLQRMGEACHGIVSAVEQAKLYGAKDLIALRAARDGAIGLSPSGLKLRPLSASGIIISVE